jgi:FkbM family methyltransferase
MDSNKNQYNDSIRVSDYPYIISGIISDMSKIYSTVDNWYSLYNLPLMKYGIIKNLNINFKDGESITLKNPDDFEMLWNSIKGKSVLKNLIKLSLKYNKDIITIKSQARLLYFYYDCKMQFLNTAYLLNDLFIKNQYASLNIKDKYVVDIGANIGDSAIYFGLNGAKHVYAFEPYPYSCKIASRNIKLNKMESKITIINKACSSFKNSFIIDPNFKNVSNIKIKNFKFGKRINMISLENIARNYHIINGALKIDCEGCEYDIILNSSNDVLRKFSNIIIEYHKGYVNLKRKIENAGFKTYISRPKLSNGNFMIGLIYAKRQ